MKQSWNSSKSNKKKNKRKKKRRKKQSQILNWWIRNGKHSVRLSSLNIGIRLKKHGLNWINLVTLNQYWKPTQDLCIKIHSHLLKSAKMMKLWIFYQTWKSQREIWMLTQITMVFFRNSLQQHRKLHKHLSIATRSFGKTQGLTL